jgi:hypothetical protein
MSFPPCILSLRVTENDRTKVRLWLPLFVLWLLLLPLLVLALVGTLLADLLTLLSGHRPGYTRLVVGVLRVFSAARGAEVMVPDKDHAGRTVAFTLR